MVGVVGGIPAAGDCGCDGRSVDPWQRITVFGPLRWHNCLVITGIASWSLSYPDSEVLILAVWHISNGNWRWVT